MPTVVVTVEPLFRSDGPPIARLRAAGFEIDYPRRVPLTEEDEVIEALRGVAAVIAGNEPYSERVLASLPALRIISRCGVGLDGVDLEAAARRGIAVAITPDGNRDAVAEHTMAMILALTRSIVRNDREVHRGQWPKTTLAPLRGKTLGNIGLGRIGRGVALRAAPFRVSVLADDPHVDDTIARAHGVELTDLDSLLARSDVVSLHLPLTPATRRMIDRALLAQMKPGALLINTARGSLVVEADLIDALRSGHLAGAGLDVLVDEPPRSDNPLLALDNVLFSPHIAANDDQSIRDITEGAAQNIIDLFQGNLSAPALITPAGGGRLGHRIY
jgi:phosphoglycerate dehydrogenase-like enzyme